MVPPDGGPSAPSGGPGAGPPDPAAPDPAAPPESAARRPLEHAKIQPHRVGEVGVQLTWTRPELERGVGWLASLLAAQFARPPARP